MRIRLVLARSLVRIGKVVESLALMVLRPEDLLDLGRSTYGTEASIKYWSSDQFVGQGLSAAEAELVQALPAHRGRLLVLGVGGGREAIPLAQAGFEVTGVDYVPGMVQSAIENASRSALAMKGLVQDVGDLDVPAGTFDVVWFSPAMYSCVPTRKKRVDLLHKVRTALKPEGMAVCQFAYDFGRRTSGAGELARRALAVLSLGNLAYETGDVLWGNQEFLHVFSSEVALRSEWQEGGFDAIDIRAPSGATRGAAMLRPAGSVGKPDQGKGLVA